MPNIFAFVKVLPSLKPKSALVRKLLGVLVVAVVAVGAFLWGRMVSQAALNQREIADAKPASTNNEGVVAYLKGNIAITRQELGEYLIQRLGADRIDNLVNRRIIELACWDKGVYVSEAEVDGQFAEDLRILNGQNVSTSDFAVEILKRFNKTMYEWKEDIIRPRLLMKKLIQTEITVTQEDIQNAYEARFGPQVKCRMIVMRPGSPAHWGLIRGQVMASKDAFYQAASNKDIQIIDVIRQKGGEIPNIYKHFGEPSVERVAFALREGEVSETIEMPDKTAVLLLCEKHIPAKTNVPPPSDEHLRNQLYREIMEAKINQKIPEKVKELRTVWDPVILLPRPTQQKSQLAMNTPQYSSDFQPPPADAVKASAESVPPVPPVPFDHPDVPPSTPPGKPGKVDLPLPPTDAMLPPTTGGQADSTTPQTAIDPIRNAFGIGTSTPPENRPVFPVPEIPGLKKN